MGDPMETIPSSEALDLETVRSRIRELRDFHGSSNDVSELSPSDLEKLLNDCAFQLQGKLNQVLAEFSDIGSLPVEDLDAYFGHLRDGLNSVEAENAEISDEIEELKRKYIEDSGQLEIELEELNCSLDFIVSKGLEKEKADGHAGASSHGEEMDFLNEKGDYKFKMLELSHQIEQNKITLKSLRNLDDIFKRFEAIEKVEDALTGLKVIECEGNHIRLSLRTCIPNIESLLSQHKIEDITAPLERNHELQIEVVGGTLELKNVEIFPNDIYIGDIIDAAKSFRQLFPNMSMLETRSSLEWFVRQVQNRIVLCTLRRLLVKENKSRHSFEYLDRDETIIAHMVGGVDAFIKIPQGWPVSNFVLKLISLKSSSHYSKEISLSFLCKVEEVANSLDTHIRQNIASFVDAIEEILMQRMRAELQSEINSEN
ncbi:hypothetical protein U1Q18_030659 [Sarracenia purpurea var. burkii]